MGVRLWHVCSWCARWGILRHGGFAIILQLRNTLQNGVSVAKWWISRRGKNRSHFAVAKWWYLAAKSHSCAMGSLRSCENFRRGGWAAAKPFRSRKPFSQQLTFAAKFRSSSFLLWNFTAHALSLLFELLLIPNFLLSHFFDIPLDFDHPKTYITSK